MIKATAITLGTLFAGPVAAQALEPVPPCFQTLHEGWRVMGGIDLYDSSFVDYFTSDQSDAKARIYLEHCPSGRVMRAEYTNDHSLPYSDPRHPDAIYGLYEGLMTSPKPVTQSQVAQALRKRGAETKIWKSQVESCVCDAFFPDSQGGKSAYKEVGE